ncbi:MAG: hypothetical protein ACJAVJ_002551 [Planctomycetota bacterium]|jgi:hypothetical protein
MSATKICLGLALALLASCNSLFIPRSIPQAELASFQRAGDFDTYRLRRIGLVPVAGTVLSESESLELQAILYSEFAGATAIEVVLLSHKDLAEISASDPHLKGVYRAETVIGISKRFRLDGMLVPTAIQRQSFPPQRLSMQVDLVSAETGMAIWNASINLMADQDPVVRGLEAFYGNGEPITDDSWSLSLLSPSQFARFAAWQLAQGL